MRSILLMRILPLLLCVCGGLAVGNAQSVHTRWVRSFGGSSIDNGKDIAVDRFGHVYTTGRFTGTSDLDPGPGVHNLTSAGSSDVFIARLDTAGNFVWARHLGGSAADYGNAIATDTSGNVYVTGYFSGTADFDPGPGVFNLTSFGSDDIYLVKLDSSGNFAWATQAGSTLGDRAEDVAVGPGGKVYLTGIYRNTVSFGSFSLTSAGGTDVFVVCLDAAGNYLWAKSLGGSQSEEGNSITVDTFGNVYTAGGFYGLTDLDPGTANYYLSSAGQLDIFVCKLDQAGSFVWAIRTGGSNNDEAISITTDLPGNVYTTGTFNGSVDFDPGAGVSTITSNTRDAYVCKLSASGTFIWAKGISGTGSAGDDGYGITVDANGNVFAAGSFSGTLNMNTGQGTLSYPSAGGQDIYLAQFSSSGNLDWVKRAGGIASDYCYNLALDGQSKLYAIGSFAQTADFSLGGVTHTATGNGLNSDIYVHKIEPGSCLPAFYQQTITACGTYTFNNQTYTASGNYLHTFLDVTGCDSIINLSLTIGGTSPPAHIYFAGCDSFVYNGSTYKTSGLYPQVYTNAGSCDSVVTLHVTISTVDNTITQSGNTFTANEPGASYQWLYCSQGMALLPGATGQSYTLTQAGSYAVVISKDGCTDTSDCLTVTGVSDMGDQDQDTQGLSVYPNPSAGLYTVQVPSPLSNAAISVTDITGRTITELSGVTGTQFRIDISAHPSGVYFLRIRTHDRILQSQLSKY